MGRWSAQGLANMPGAAGQLTATRDAAGRITALTEAVVDIFPGPLPTGSGSSSQFGYTPDSLPSTATLDAGGGQVLEQRSYDADNRLTCLTAAGPPTATQPLADGFTYSVSAQGVITGLTSQTTAACDSSGNQPAIVVNHDVLGRLSATNGASWSYDGNGNLLTQTVTQQGQSVPTVYNYANADGTEPAGWLPNELVSTTYGTRTGQLAEGFGYDASGNTTAITVGASGTQPQVTKTLTYNAQGRLAGVTTSDGLTVTLGDNAWGLRSSITVTDTHPEYGPTASFTERLRHRGDRVGQVTVQEGTKQFSETFLYRPDGSPLELLYQQPGQAIVRYWYIVDGQGSVIALVNSLGPVVDHYQYDLWGNPVVDPTTGDRRRGATAAALSRLLS